MSPARRSLAANTPSERNSRARIGATTGIEPRLDLDQVGADASLGEVDQLGPEVVGDRVRRLGADGTQPLLGQDPEVGDGDRGAVLALAEGGPVGLGDAGSKRRLEGLSAREAGDDGLGDRPKGNQVRLRLLQLIGHQDADLVAGGVVVEGAHRAVGEAVGVDDVALGVDRELADQQEAGSRSRSARWWPPGASLLPSWARAQPSHRRSSMSAIGAPRLGREAH